MVGSTTRHQAIPLALLALGFALLGAAPAPAASPVDSQRVTQPGGDVRDHWTKARLRAAEPVEAPLASPDAGVSAEGERGASSSSAPSYVFAAAPGQPGHTVLRDGSPGHPTDDIVPGTTRDEILEPASPEFSAHGKVFFTVPSGEEAGDYVCSGTAVNSRNGSVVWTAGHCVFPEERTGFATNWTFIPAYHEGSQPYGQWPAKRLATTGPWQEAGNIKYDLGAAVVRPDAEGQRLQVVVGARGIGFDQPRDQTYRAYGYPAVSTLNPDFTGEREFRCTSPPTGTDEPGTAGPPTMAIECDMAGGSSGGGWIVDTTLLSVTSYGYLTELDQLYGPYMSQSAKTLYRSVRGKPKRKSSGSKGSQGSKGGKGPKGPKGKR